MHLCADFSFMHTLLGIISPNVMGLFMFTKSLTWVDLGASWLKAENIKKSQWHYSH